MSDLPDTEPAAEPGNPHAGHRNRPALGAVAGRAAPFVVAAVAALALALPAALWLARSPADLTPYERLGAEIGCQCGTCPNRPIATCGCGFADGMLADLRAAIDAGQSDDEILATFAARYGPGIRIKPATRGLDLAAWLAPIAFLLVGSVVVAAVIARWKGDNEQPGAAVAGPAGADRAASAANRTVAADRASADQGRTAGASGAAPGPSRASPESITSDEAERLRAIVERELENLAE